MMPLYSPISDAVLQEACSPVRNTEQRGAQLHDVPVLSRQRCCPAGGLQPSQENKAARGADDDMLGATIAL